MEKSCLNCKPPGTGLLETVWDHSKQNLTARNIQKKVLYKKIERYYTIYIDHFTKVKIHLNLSQS